MFKTIEEYQQALAALQTPEEQQAFIQQHGDGSGLPTADQLRLEELEAKHTILATEPMSDEVLTGPIDWTKQEREEERTPLSGSELKELAEYERLSKDEAAMRQIERNIEDRKLEYAVRDPQGNVVYGPDGEPIEREVSTGEMMLNSVNNMVADFKAQGSALNIGVNEVVQKIFGDAAVERWARNDDSGFWDAFTDEATEDYIRQKAIEESERDEHTGRYTGEDSNIAAAFVNSVTSIGSSAAINTLTLGGGLPFQFFGDFYDTYNKTVAEEKGISLKELRDRGEDSFWAPMAFGALAGLSERAGLKGAGKAITNKVAGTGGKKLVHRLLSGNKEGLTELFQTGLEAANEAHAKGEDSGQAFADAAFSEDGLESYLQGFTGGATLAGKGQDQHENIKKIRKAIGALRAPVDTRRIESLIAKQVDLRQKMSKTTNPLALEALDRQLQETNKELKNIVPKANGLARKATEKQVDDLVRYQTQAKELEAKQKEMFEQYKQGQIEKDVYTEAWKANKNQLDLIKDKAGKIAAELENQPNLVEKDMTTPNATGVWNTKTKFKINELKDDKSNIWDILEDRSVKDFVTAKVRSAWQKLPEGDRQKTTFEDVLSDVMYGGKQQSQSLRGLLESYKPGEKAAPSTYVLKPLDQKISGVLQDLTGQKVGREFDKQIEAPTEGGYGIQAIDEGSSVEAVLEGETRQREMNAPVLAKRLGFSPAIAEDAKTEATQFVANNQTFEGDKKLEQNASKFFRDKLKNKIQAAMGKKDDYFRFLTANANNLIKALPKKALALRRDESQAWAENPPTPQEFVEYMRSGNQTKKKRALAELLADTMGLRAAKDVIESNPDLQAQHEAEVQQEQDQNADEVQKATDGNWYDTFTPDNIAEDDYEAQEQATDKILEKHKIEKTPVLGKRVKGVDVRQDEAIEEYKNWIEGVMTKYFPREFFQQGMFANAGKDGWRRGFAYDNVEQSNAVGELAKSDPNSVFAKNGRYHYKHKSPDKIKAEWAKVSQTNKDNQAAFNEMWRIFDKMIADDPNNARMISAFLKGAQNSQNHISRTGAPILAFSHKGPWEEEHTMPQSSVSRYLLQTILDGKDLNKALENTNKNFFQVGLNKTDDAKLKKVKLNSKMPEGWKPSMNSWARYFNAAVNGVDGGIDPNSIEFFETGKTVAETFGAGTAAPKNGVVVKAQQEVVAEQVGDRIEQNFDKIINSINKLLGDRGALHTNFAHIPVHVLVGGLRAAKLAYRGARDLASAIEAGYQQVKDYMSRQEWGDFTSKAIKVVKNHKTGKQEGLQFATENAIALQQQADLNDQFDQIIERKTKGRIKAGYKFEKADIGKPKKIGLIRKFFAHPSAEDFKGLLYTILPSGKEGDAALKFFQDALIRPYQKGVNQMNAYKANLHEGFKLASKLAGVKKLNSTVPETFHTWNNAVRVAMAVRSGQEVNGMNPETVEVLSSAVEADSKMSAFADKMLELFDGNYEWSPENVNDSLGGEIASVADKVNRKEFIGDFIENADKIFTEENLNKIEAAAGREVRENLEKTIARMKSGKNRTISTDSSTNKLLDWVNNSVAMIMFANMRSASLQLLSSLNYLADGNNVFKAAKNMAKAGQWKDDIKFLWDSDYSVGRRKGLGFDISAAEIADAAGDKGALSALMDRVREAGFLPTKIMDSVTINMFGALYYRSQLDKYKKEGHPNPQEAAYDDFVAMSEENQQSADPSKISQIQAGPLGRIVFAFGNTPFQYARIMKRAAQDLASGRGNPRKNIQKIVWYGGLQSVLFTTLQQALWMGEDEEEKDERKEWAAVSTITSWFKSLGLGGAFASTAMNLLYETTKNRPDYAKAAVAISPPISKKLSQAAQLGKAISNDDWVKATAVGAELGGNIPAHRVMIKLENLKGIVEGDLTGPEMLMKTLGWSDYSLGIADPEVRQRPKFKRKKNPFGDKPDFRKKSPFDKRSPFSFDIEKTNYTDSPFKSLKEIYDKNN